MGLYKTRTKHRFLAGPLTAVALAVKSLSMQSVIFCLIMTLLWFPPSRSQTEGSLRQAGPKDESEWQSLFDGKTLQRWQVANFGGQGNVHIEDGKIILEMGGDLTGITWEGELPKVNYEVAIEAMRVEGSDFFCGMTFPVGDSFCSLIVGGWGGTVVGLSSINGKDASENATSRLVNFDLNRWYRIRLRVIEGRIEAWIDDQKVVAQETTGKSISIRPEVDLSRPFGIASWRTKAALRNIRLRHIAGSRK